MSLLMVSVFVVVLAIFGVEFAKLIKPLPENISANNSESVRKYTYQIYDYPQDSN